MDYFKAALQWAFCLAANIVLDGMGLVIVAIALPFRKEGVSVSDGRKIINLPRWAWLWGNDFDGVLGDKRGWWAENTPFGWDVNGYMAMYWWTAIRNPANNMRRVSLFSAPIIGSEITYNGYFTVEDDRGGDGWQFVKLVSQKGRSYYGFYWVKEYQIVQDRAFVIRMGFKIKPSHAGSQEQPKGMTTRINPWKRT
jgi:hypothetical protein